MPWYLLPAASVAFLLIGGIFLLRRHLRGASLLGALAALTLLVSVVLPKQYEPNPDPNHTHADFAVWVGGTQLDFSGEEYMSGVSTDTGSHPAEGPRKYLHLHDGNGEVAHRHKPGLTFGEFMVSNLGLNVLREAGETGEASCLYRDTVRTGTGASAEPSGECISGNIRAFVNGREMTPLALAGYVFEDMDRILLTDSADEAEVRRQLESLSDDACKYSRTCPWKGAPPTENCIADPTVPCVVE